MVIEFIGTPGAGKTTLLPDVVEYLNACGYRAFSVIEAARPFAKRTLIGEAVSRLAPPPLQGPLLWQVFYQYSKLYRKKFYKKHTALIRHVISSQKNRPIPHDARHHALYWFFHLVGYYEFLSTYAKLDEALVFDEGFIHRVVQLNASDVEEPDPAQIYTYIDLLPRPDLVIFPEASLKTCETRIYRRGLWERFKNKSTLEVSRYIANSYLVVHLAVDYIKSKGWTVYELDNDGDDPTITAAALLSTLSGLPALTCKLPQVPSIM